MRFKDWSGWIREPDARCGNRGNHQTNKSGDLKPDARCGNRGNH